MMLTDEQKQALKHTATMLSIRVLAQYKEPEKEAYYLAYNLIMSTLHDSLYDEHLQRYSAEWERYVKEVNKDKTILDVMGYYKVLAYILEQHPYLESQDAT